MRGRSRSQQSPDDDYERRLTDTDYHWYVRDANAPFAVRELSDSEAQESAQKQRDDVDARVARMEREGRGASDD